MSHVLETTQFNIKEYLSNLESKSLLRFITCGSVDDGKSTLIGRLLYETNSIKENEIETLEKDSKKFGTTDAIDFALLVDGLSSEREQGITIDVAYRFFSTAKREFIVADTPGHEQYTRNMATGASTAEAAIVMVDASKGLLTQTRRHSHIISMLGVKHVIVAVNKMDLVNYNQIIFKNIERDYIELAKQLNFTEVKIIPVSALTGDNVCFKTNATPWYQGPGLLEALEAMQISAHSNEKFRFCVQWVNRPNLNFRAYAGTIASGTIKPGETVRILPQGLESKVKSIETFDGSLNEASTGQAINLTIEDNIDISRGDVITKANTPIEVADKFKTSLLWMSEKPLVLGRQYLFKLGTVEAIATPTNLKYQIDINTNEKTASSTLNLNEIGVTELLLNKTICYEAYKENKTLGGFILIDRMSNETAACGFIKFALRRSGNIHKQAFSVTQKERSDIKPHRPCVLWFTGISGAGKSTIANLVEASLNSQHAHTITLDGDNIRHGLNKDLGFTESDRAENIRRIAEVAKLMTDAGLISLVSFISPFKAERLLAKSLVGEENFIEIYVDTSIDVAEERDIKGLYKKARRGEIKNFTGIDSPYEPPQQCDIHIDTKKTSAEDAAKLILHTLTEKGII